MSYYLECSQQLPQQTGMLDVELSWSIHEGCAAVDLDVSAVCFSSKGSLVDAAYYNQLTAVNGAVVHGGDCRGKDKNNFSETVKIALGGLEGVSVIVFLVSAFTDGCLEACESATCKVLHDSDVLAKMSNTRLQMGTSASLMLFMLFKHPDTQLWSFAEIRKPVNGRHFYACLTKMRYEVDMVIDPESYFARSFSDDKTFEMEKGDQLSIPCKVHKLLVGLGWTPRIDGVEIDLDAACVMLTRNAAGQLTPYDLSNGEPASTIRPGVQHCGDNTTGEGDGDDEEIVLDLTQVEPNVAALAIVVTIFNKKFTFGDIHDSYVRLVDYDTDHVYAKFTLGDTLVKSGVVLCLLERGTAPADPWTLMTVGEEVDAKTARFVRSNLWESFYAAQGQVTSQTEGSPVVYAERKINPKPISVPVSVPSLLEPLEAPSAAPVPQEAPVSPVVEDASAEATTTSEQSASCLPDVADLLKTSPSAATTQEEVSAAEDLPAAPATPAAQSQQLLPPVAPAAAPEAQQARFLAGSATVPAVVPTATPVTPKPRKASTGPVKDCLAESEELARQEGAIRVSLDWAMKLGSSAVDLDASAVCFSGTGTLVDAAYYNQLSAVDGAVVHSGDYKCGEKIDVSLDASRGVRIIVFVVSAYSGGDLSACESTTCTVTQGSETLASMSLTAQSNSSSLLLCMLFKHPDTRKWHFSEVRHPVRGRHFSACLHSLRAVVDQVIDPGLIQERNLSKDRVFNMEKCDEATVPAAMRRVRIGLGWTAKAGTIDLDAACIILTRTADGQLTPVDIASGEEGRRVRPGVQHLGDNTTGHGDGDDEQILIDLSVVEEHVAALAVVVTNANSKCTFKDVTDSYVRVLSEDGDQVYAKFALNDALTMPAVVFCLLERGATSAEPWTLATIGEEVKGKSGKFVTSKLWEGYYASPGQRITNNPAAPMVDEIVRTSECAAPAGPATGSVVTPANAADVFTPACTMDMDIMEELNALSNILDKQDQDAKVVGSSNAACCVIS
jgi:tellurium resistance protein TerD